MTDNSTTILRLAAVGDLLLATDCRPGAAAVAPPVAAAVAQPGAVAASRAAELFAGLRGAFADCDLVFGNLECTLPGDGGAVPTEPRVVSRPELVRAVRAAGFNVVTLANNHMFDCLDGGFHNLRALLNELGVRHFGAGDNLAEAAAPVIVEVRGQRVAFLGAADERSGTRHFATADHWGIAPLDVERLVGQTAELRTQAYQVIVSLHWGEERFGLPAPEQVAIARRLAEAGASLIIGHHPHVIQGLEMIDATIAVTASGGGAVSTGAAGSAAIIRPEAASAIRRRVPVAYSLGNCVANEVPYTSGDRLTWSRRERTGCLLRCDLGPAGATDVEQVAIVDEGQRIVVDRSGYGDRLIARANRAVAGGVTLRRYRREHLWVKTIRPILAHLRWRELKRLRWAQVTRALRSLRQAGRAK